MRMILTINYVDSKFQKKTLCLFEKCWPVLGVKGIVVVVLDSGWVKNLDVIFCSTFLFKDSFFESIHLVLNFASNRWAVVSVAIEEDEFSECFLKIISFLGELDFGCDFSKVFLFFLNCLGSWVFLFRFWSPKDVLRISSFIFVWLFYCPPKEKIGFNSFPVKRFLCSLCWKTCCTRSWPLLLALLFQHRQIFPSEHVVGKIKHSWILQVCFRESRSLLCGGMQKNSILGYNELEKIFIQDFPPKVWCSTKKIWIPIWHDLFLSTHFYLFY